jgi:hypothetical protein
MQQWGSCYSVGFAQQYGSKAGKPNHLLLTQGDCVPDMSQRSQSEPPDGYIFVNSKLLQTYDHSILAHHAPRERDFP